MASEVYHYVKYLVEHRAGPTRDYDLVSREVQRYLRHSTTLLLDESIFGTSLCRLWSHRDGPLFLCPYPTQLSTNSSVWHPTSVRTTVRQLYEDVRAQLPSLASNNEEEEQEEEEEGEKEAQEEADDNDDKNNAFACFEKELDLLDLDDLVACVLKDQEESTVSCEESLILDT